MVGVKGLDELGLWEMWIEDYLGQMITLCNFRRTGVECWYLFVTFSHPLMDLELFDIEGESINSIY